MYSHGQGHPLHSQQASNQAHTPTLEYFGGGESSRAAAQMTTVFNATGAPMKPVSAIWSDGKFREEYDGCKARLTDSSKFNIRVYPDPLLPRQQSQADFYPKGMTPELEAHLKGVIAQVKGSS
ncbi:hypothetical protein SLS62_000650 [Diatrype stigma]|uniref:Uncharacterized protein n=1 Tax=Diatrype stigma TaxID=117547 RepID=A0AAN9VBK1_9PEZI